MCEWFLQEPVVPASRALHLESPIVPWDRLCYPLPADLCIWWVICERMTGRVVKAFNCSSKMQPGPKYNWQAFVESNRTFRDLTCILLPFWLLPPLSAPRSLKVRMSAFQAEDGGFKSPRGGHFLLLHYIRQDSWRHLLPRPSLCMIGNRDVVNREAYAWAR